MSKLPRELTDEQKRELNHRIEDSEANPEDTLTWQEVRSSIEK
ncbi:addiction module protein [Dulcicalothrix desertica]